MRRFWFPRRAQSYPKLCYLFGHDLGPSTFGLKCYRCGLRLTYVGRRRR